MTHASVFSGIGGPEVAAAMLGWENLFHCEINPFGRKVLEYWFPKSKSYEDITKTDFTEWRGRVNVLTGGFPCQPFSYAGQRRGAEDDRYLWPHMHRCINEVQPDWVVCENVAGILTMVEQGEVSPMESQATMFDEGDILRRYRLTETFTLERISRDIEADGYEVQSVLVPACAVGAPHRRDRVFIVGHRRDTILEDTLRRRHMERGNDEQGSERNERNTGARGGERICGETSGTAPADTLLRGGIPSREGETSQGDGIEKLSEQDGQREGHTPSGHPRLSRLPRTSTDTRSGGQSTPEQQSERARQTIQRESGIEPFDGIGRPRTPRTTPDPDCHRGREVDEHMESEQPNGAKSFGNGREWDATDTDSNGHSTQAESRRFEDGRRSDNGESCQWSESTEWIKRFHPLLRGDEAGHGRWRGFPTVSPIHRGNDGIPFPLDDLTISSGKWRTESLKAYGNAIVPQVMYEIFLAILKTEQSMKEL